MDELVKQKELKEQTEQDLKPLANRLETQNNRIADLVKKKERIIKDINRNNQKLEKLNEDLKFKENIIMEYKKKQQEIEGKLKEQQKAYENVRSEKNIYSKNLIETQDEIAEVKKRLRIVNNQIGDCNQDQLMEEADAKKKALNMEMFQVKVWQKKHEKLQKINEDFKKSILKKEQFIKIFVNEICKLKFIKKNIDSKLKNIEQFYNTIISERDILGTQLIKVD